MQGYSPGWGQLKEKVQTDSMGCAKLCNHQDECCSYEHSPAEKLCNLNKDCKPTAQKYMEYNFCVKG